MYEFNIELPKEVLAPGKHETIDFSSLEGKVIIGLMGYAKSGKDTITKTFIEEYGYHRVAFADNIKKEMNQYLKELVCEDINARGEHFVSVGVIDFFTENLELKKILRPYIIWYGEKLRTVNGKFCWINKAFNEDGKNYDKIILSDVRRLAELDIFKNSNEFKKRYIQSLGEAGLSESQNTPINNFGTLLFEVNQYGLTDSDVLTIETIQVAREQWLIDDTFYVDSRIPDTGNARQRAIQPQIKRVIKKFGIEKPEKVKYTQTTIFEAMPDSEKS